MERKAGLSKTMSLSQFDNGYWYATEIKSFARDIGIAGVSSLRKDELEILIRRFLKTGSISKAKRNLASVDGPKDSEVGLTLKSRVRKYTNNTETKEFIIKSARTMDKTFVEKSGARYRLNRWREEQIGKGPFPGRRTQGLEEAEKARYPKELSCVEKTHVVR